jgi:hypothetical protein
MSTTITGSSIQVGSIDLTTPLAVADGGTGIGTSRVLAQIQSFATGAVATGTTTIPVDNTIPQSTEGDQYMALTITPTSATSTLEIEVVANYSHSAAGGFIATALFKDSTANALAVSATSASATYNQNSKIIYSMTSGTTSATTFKVRIGSSAAGTLTFNGLTAGGIYGGTFSSSITIKEWLA